MLSICRLVVCGLTLLAAIGPAGVEAAPRAHLGLAAIGTAWSIRIDHVVQGTVIGSPPQAVQIQTTNFVDASHGFLATQNGSCATPKGCSSALLLTLNGGQTWHVVHTGTAFFDLSFLSPDRGYGVTATGRLVKTVDGGRHWTASPAPARQASRVDFVNAQHGWLLAGDLYRTSDAGRSWTHLPFHCGRMTSIARISFVDSRTGFLLCRVQNGPFPISLYRSDDTGTSWRKISFVDRMAHALGAFDFISPRVGFVSAGFGDLLRTDDGGHSFEGVLGTPFESVQAASWLGGRTGYVATLNALMKTEDAGSHWRQLYPAVMPQGSIALSSSGAGLGAGISWFPAAILATRGGTHWDLVRQVPTALPGPSGEVITSVDGLVRIPSSSFWMVAPLVDSSTYRVYLLRSRDSGRHWSIVLNLTGGSGSISFTEARQGAFVTSMPFRLYTTDDGGKTWSRRPHSMQTWNDQVVSSSVMWAFGAGGSLLRTADGGRHWQQIAIRVQDFRTTGLYFLNPRDGWITGNRCASTPCAPGILRTRDGGAHWTLIRFRQSFTSDGFDWVTPQVGYVVHNGALYRTADGGNTWHMLGR